MPPFPTTGGDHPPAVVGTHPSAKAGFPLLFTACAVKCPLSHCRPPEYLDKNTVYYINPLRSSKANG